MTTRWWKKIRLGSDIFHKKKYEEEDHEDLHAGKRRRLKDEGGKYFQQS